MKLDSMKGLKRTNYCSVDYKVGETVTVMGFADRVRDMGNLIFINLRDRTGLVQLTFGDATDRHLMTRQTEPFLKRHRMSRASMCWRLWAL